VRDRGSSLSDHHPEETADAAPQRVGWFRFYFDQDRWEWSDVVQQMHGYEPGAMPSPTVQQVLSHKHPDDYPQVVALFDHIQRRRIALSSRHRIIDTTGRVHYVVVVGDELRDEHGIRRSQAVGSQTMDSYAPEWTRDRRLSWISLVLVDYWYIRRLFCGCCRRSRPLQPLSSLPVTEPFARFAPTRSRIRAGRPEPTTERRKPPGNRPQRGEPRAGLPAHPRLPRPRNALPRTR
jgi:PAS fold